MKGGADSDFTGDAHRPVVNLDGSEHCGKPQTGAGTVLFGGKKRLKNSLQIVLCNAATVVTQFNVDEASRLQLEDRCPDTLSRPAAEPAKR